VICVCQLLTTPRMPFNNSIPATMSMDGSIPNLTVDQTQYMAPMDLYDSIWGGKSTSECSTRGLG